MDKIFIDFETKSDLNLKKVGAMKYFHTPNSDLVSLSWCRNPKRFYGEGEVKLWIPGMRPPFIPNTEIKIYAHNAIFDFRAWNILGRKYGFRPLKLEYMVDTMALCTRFTYYAGLDQAAKVLRLPIAKDVRGKNLIKKITQPPFKYTKKELHTFYEYCMNDTHTMIGIVNSLPKDKLPPLEQTIWEITQKINMTGLPIDYKLVKRVWAVIKYYKEKEIQKLPDLTNGEVCNVTQTQAIVVWTNEKGVDMKNCTAPEVLRIITELEDKEELSKDEESVLKVLQMRKDLGRTSVAKYDKLLHQTYKGVIYDNIRYHIASTGRWGGSGFQAHNLPRATVDDIERTIEKFYDTTILSDNPVYAGMALIRSCICAVKGKRFVVRDYKSIENILLAWVADEERILQLHRDGFDEYVDFATTLYETNYDDVSKEQRRHSKVVILGAGYGLGSDGLLEYALSWGIKFNEYQCVEAIAKYRQTHSKIKSLWYGLKDAAVAAVLNKEHFYTHGKCRFVCTQDKHSNWWLVLRLPSGRSLFYSDPEVREDKFGPVPTHMGINSYNKQWQRQKLIPGRITENVIQALARDILANGKINVLNAGYDINLSVHDEIVSQVPMETAHDDLNKINALMCKLPDWAVDLPLKAEGEVLKRYKKI